mgnify:CR=1 FL=1
MHFIAFCTFFFGLLSLGSFLSIAGASGANNFHVVALLGFLENTKIQSEGE